MSNLENLVSKIKADAQAKADTIIADAKTEANGIIVNYENEANKLKEDIMVSAKLESARQKEQVVSAKKIEIRDSLLKAKREAMEKVLGETHNKLNDMNIEKFTEFFTAYAHKLDLKGDEKIVVPSKYKDLDLSKVNKMLADKGKKGELEFLEGKREIDSGFIVVKDGIENNNTFLSLIDFYRDELEKIIVENLF